MPRASGQTPSPTPDSTPADPPAPIHGRILLHVKGTEHAPLSRVSSTAGGVVFSGKQAGSHLAEFRRLRERDCPTVLGPSEYEHYAATPEEPLLRKDPNLFSGDGLEDTLERLLESSASLVLTPTGFLQADAEGLKALQKAAEQVDYLDTGRVILALPLEARWLDDEPDVLVEILHTDLAGLDAMVYGAAFASIGDTSSTRHRALPWAKPRRNNNRDKSPDVLSPHLMKYIKGSGLAEYAGHELLRCECTFCVEWAVERRRREPGRLLSEFHDKADKADAHAHNMAVWSGLWAYLARDGSLVSAQERWKRLCSAAVDSYAEFNEVMATGFKPFEPSSVLRYWAGLPEKRR